MEQPLKYSFRHMTEYAVLSTAVFLANLLPLRLALAWGAVHGYAAWFLGVRRGIVLINLRQAFPENTQKANKRIGARSYANIGRTMVEIARQKRIDDRYIARNITVEGVENQNVLRREGGIGLSFHFGNWEMMGLLQRHLVGDTSFLVGEQHNELVDGLLNRHRAAHGIKLITRDGAMKEIFRVLREKRIVSWLSDQDAGKNGIVVDFFGWPASTPRGAAAFAVKTGCAVFPIALVREKGPCQTLVYGAPIRAPKDMPADSAETRVTREYTAFLEEMARRRPDLYWWPHRRWKTTGLYRKPREEKSPHGK
jgi:KDO2-lipid IV(A) lauroyltransferase